MPSDSFHSTEQRLAVTCQRHPAFPREPATLVRLVKHVHKRLHDQGNALLKPWGISHPEYNILMMLYGTDGYTLHPRELAAAAGEKSANITRLTDQLCEKALIERRPSEQDRRKLTLTLSRRGIKLIERFLPDICGLLERQTAELAPRDLAQLERLLKKFLDQLDRAE